jgi:hypothetical protein
MSEQLLFGGAFSVVLPDNRDDLRSVFMIPFMEIILLFIVMKHDY